MEEEIEEEDGAEEGIGAAVATFGGKRVVAEGGEGPGSFHHADN